MNWERIGCWIYENRIPIVIGVLILLVCGFHGCELHVSIQSVGGH